jgi:hypothetical protein
MSTLKIFRKEYKYKFKFEPGNVDLPPQPSLLQRGRELNPLPCREGGRGKGLDSPCSKKIFFSFSGVPRGIVASKSTGPVGPRDVVNIVKKERSHE